MKQSYLLFLCALLCSFLSAQTTAIPDATFENFLISQGIDTNGANGNILNADAQSVTTLLISEVPVSNWSGIEAFINLTELRITASGPTSTNQATATSINLSALTNLEYLMYRRNAHLTSLDVSANIALKTLVASQNTVQTQLILNSGLTDLNIFGIGPAGGLTINFLNSTALQNLVAYGGKLTSLDLSNCNNLIDAEIYSSTLLNSITLPTSSSLERLRADGLVALSSMDLSKQSNLKILNLGGSSGLTSIDLSNNINLETINVKDSPITNIDFSNTSVLKSINAENTVFTSVDLSDCLGLEVVLFKNSSLTSLDLSNQANIIDINCNNSSNLNSVTLAPTNTLTDFRSENTVIGTLDLSNQTALSTLFILPNNSLTTLNVSGCTSISDLDVGNGNTGNVSNLNVSNCTALETLDFRDNNINVLTLGSSLPSLTHIYGMNNQLSTINLSAFTALEFIDLSNNFLNILTLGTHNSLTEINASGNDISTLNITGAPSLQTLNMETNSLSSLDFSNATNLQFLNLNDNNFNTINVSPAISLSSFTINDNTGLTGITVGASSPILVLRAINCNLSTLDLSNLINLNSLEVGNNNLSSLDFSNINSIVVVDISYNQFTTLPNIPASANAINCSNNLIPLLDFSSFNILGDLVCGNTSLTSLNVKNGTNQTNNLIVNSTGSPNLGCIEVDNEADANGGNVPYFMWQKDAGTVFSENCASLSTENFGTDRVALHPNPIQSEFKLDYRNQNIKSLQLYSLHGQLIKHLNPSLKRFDVSNLGNGIYLLKIETEFTSSTLKLIKE
ncbi:T9SS type A sorting domain-containing protein [Hyunsoonleella rubra]|uniref:T9SS type A sorting domain-containing protein n=1 Tax=Hyunsoonleella rubra TaxID=1737062 RepID=A0ABW5TFW6_9FLAO